MNPGPDSPRVTISIGPIDSPSEQVYGITDPRQSHPIFLHVAISNPTTYQISYATNETALGTFGFSVRKADGEEASLTEFGHRQLYLLVGGFERVILPGQAKTTLIRLNDFFDMSKRGKYQIAISVHLRILNPDPNGPQSEEIQSNIAALVIQ